MASDPHSSLRKVLALSGGVGGAKLALGLAKTLNVDQLTIVANTADDFEHLGLYISPDLDTVMYTLAGLNNTSQGWGLAGESWQMMDAIESLGGESWFRLGDRDLATHVLRSQRLREGKSLSDVTSDLAKKLGVNHRLLPMTEDAVRTRVKTTMGELDFQTYFVREQCIPAVSDVYFEGGDVAKPQAEFVSLLADDALDAIIICPSNPFVSVEPILRLKGIRDLLASSQAPVIAVSPIVGGLALKGPAAKMMMELNMPVTAQAVAAYYGDLLDGFVLDHADADLADAISHTGVRVLTTETVMTTLQDRKDLAQSVLAFARDLSSLNTG